jgi:hypothetical protein
MTTDIVRELQATRPAASDALRDRVREIAIREPVSRPSIASRLGLRRRLLLVVPAAAVAVAVAVGVVVLSRTQSVREATPTAQEDAATGSTSLTAPATAKTDSADAPAGGEANRASGPTPTTGRAQRYQAQLAIEVADPDALSAATQKALSTARSLGGHVVSVSYSSADTGSAQLLLRVPTNRVQEAIVTLSGLGRIVSQQVQIDDLQGALDETDAMIASVRERIARIGARLESTTLDDGTRATLEARRATARQQLAELRAQRAATAGEAALATIQLALSTPSGQSAIPAAPSRFDRSLDDAARILVWEATGALYFLVVAAPVALLAAGAWLLTRTFRRRADERLLA